LQKGSPIFVEGVLQSRSWETSDGQKRSTIDVRAERVQFLATFKASTGQTAPSQQNTETESLVPAPDPETIRPEDVAWDE